MNKDDRFFRGIFRRGSRTYFNSSRFFPRRIRGDITCLYGFVRTADDFVDAVPQDPAGFAAFRQIYFAGRVNGRDSGNPIIDRFLELSRRRSFRLDWVEAFLDSMAMDLTKKDYLDLGETLMYMYGSAEVIGLMMSRIMGLDERAFPYARLLGRAMQYINFIRDIQEDLDLGRTYLPQNELRAAGLESLSEQAARGRPDAFRSYPAAPDLPLAGPGKRPRGRATLSFPGGSGLPSGRLPTCMRGRLVGSSPIHSSSSGPRSNLPAPGSCKQA